MNKTELISKCREVKRWIEVASLSPQMELQSNFHSKIDISSFQWSKDIFERRMFTIPCEDRTESGLTCIKHIFKICKNSNITPGFLTHDAKYRIPTTCGSIV